MDSRNTRRGYYIFRAWTTIKGERVYAKSKGKKAFKIWVPLDKA